MDVTIGESYPIPQINEILDQLGNCKYFSTLDLASGFHQTVETKDAEKTAVSVPVGHFQFKIMKTQSDSEDIPSPSIRCNV